jgi:hypothetical protein
LWKDNGEPLARRYLVWVQCGHGNLMSCGTPATYTISQPVGSDTFACSACLLFEGRLCVQVQDHLIQPWGSPVRHHHKWDSVPHSHIKWRTCVLAVAAQTTPGPTQCAVGFQGLQIYPPALCTLQHLYSTYLYGGCDLDHGIRCHDTT